MEPAVDEKVCPQCAETVKAAARVCRYCGHHFDGATQTRGLGILIWAGASAVLMAIGSFGPWIDALGQSVAGTDSSNDGWLVVGAAIVGALLLYGTRTNRGAGLWPLLAGVLGAATTIYDRHHTTQAITNAGLPGLARIGWGLNLAVASISFALAGLIWLFAVPSVQPRSNPETDTSNDGEGAESQAAAS